MDSSITPVLPVGGGMDGIGGGNAFIWIFGLLILLGLFNGGFGGFGGTRGPAPATQEYVQSAIDNAGINSQLQQIALSSAGNNYETARLIDGLGSSIMQQNQTNLVNAIQGFNQIGSKLDALGYQMQNCCCDIKTQMLEQRLADANAALVAAQGVISNANQSQYLLSQLGTYTPGTAV